MIEFSTSLLRIPTGGFKDDPKLTADQWEKLYLKERRLIKNGRQSVDDVKLIPGKIEKLCADDYLAPPIQPC